VAMAIVPSLTAVVVLTSPFHQLMRNLETFNVWPREVQYTRGAWFAVHNTYTILLAICLVLVIIFALTKAPKEKRGAGVFFVIGLIFALGGNLVHVLGVLPFDVNPTYLGTGLAIIFIHLAHTDNKHGIIFRFMNTLRSRTTFPVLFAMFLLMIVVVVFVTRTTRISMEQAEESAFEAATRAVRAHMDTAELVLRNTTKALSDSATFLHAIHNGTQEEIWQAVHDAAVRFEVDEIIVSDAEGFTLARSHIPSHMHNPAEGVNAFGDNISGVPSMAAALRGENRILYTPTPTAEMVMTATAPIMDGENLLGGMVVNFTIGTDDFLEGLKELFGIDATVFNRSGYSVASTLIHPMHGTRAVGTQADNNIIQTVMGQGQEMTLLLDVFDTLPYYAHYFALPGVDGTPNAMMFIGLSREVGFAARNIEQRNIALIALSGIAIVSVIMYFLIFASLKSLSGLGATLKDVAAGNINVNIDRAKITTDEIGTLTSDVCELVDVVKSMVDDLSGTRHNVYTLGDWSYKIDTEKYQNSFREVVEGVNAIVEENLTDLRLQIDILNRLSDGDFAIEVKDRVGDFNIQPQAVRAVVANLQSVMTEMNGMIHAAAVLGDLRYSIDYSRFNGGWRELMQGLEGFAKAVEKPVAEIRDVMEKLALGDFSTTVTGNYAGDFLVIKNAVNATMDALSTYIAEISRALAAVADGDLTMAITRDFVGEFATIKKSINNISDTLRNTIKEIFLAADQVLSGAKQISTSAVDLANGAQDQAASVEELNTSIELISMQTRQNAENATEANAISDKSTTSAGEGNNAMAQMLTAMEQIKESSGAISKIIQAIQDIAFQTNLLALNAAVEAARAGEHGKGFAVVAEEVRSLAARSQASAKETTALIEASISRVENGADIAEATSSSLAAIVKNAADVTAIINKIASASNEQIDAIAVVSEGLMDVVRVVQSNSAISEETATASEELSSQAEVLQQLVGYFRIK